MSLPQELESLYTEYLKNLDHHIKYTCSNPPPHKHPHEIFVAFFYTPDNYVRRIYLEVSWGEHGYGVVLCPTIKLPRYLLHDKFIGRLRTDFPGACLIFPAPPSTALKSATSFFENMVPIFQMLFALQMGQLVLAMIDRKSS